MSNPEKRKPRTVFAVVPDEEVKGVFIAMWENYLGDIKTMSFKADDELGAYQKATTYLETRRSRKK